MSQIDEITGLVKVGGDIADNLTTSDEEERNLISAVHKADMESDSWLSKNIRPMFLIYCVLLLTLLFLLEGFKVQFSEGLKNILMTWGSIAVTAYFGSRGFQHVARINQRGKIISARIARKEAITEARIERKENRSGLFNRKKDEKQ